MLENLTAIEAIFLGACIGIGVICFSSVSMHYIKLIIEAAKSFNKKDK